MAEVEFKYDDFYGRLEKLGIKLTEAQRERVTARLEKYLSYEPRVGVFGKTGVGKSTLCNALFGQNVCAISDIEACTRAPQEVLVGIGTKGIKLVDVPGVGESAERDSEYKQLYRSLLPELDVALWLLRGSDRAYEADERFYGTVVRPHIDRGKPFFFVINAADEIQPLREWDADRRKPSVQQSKNIEAKVQHVSDRFQVQKSKVIAVSAGEKWNLTELVDEIVTALPREKRITIVDEIVPEAASEETKTYARQSFIDAALEVVEEIASAVKDWVVEAVGKVIRNVPGWIGSLFR